MMKLRIATAPYGNKMNNCSLTQLEASNNCPVPGIDAEILSFILSYMKMSYELFPNYKPEWGSYQNGNWSGLLGLVQNGTYDTIGSTYVETAKRLEDFAFSYPVHQDEPTILVKKPTANFFDSALLIFRVFELDLWATIGVTFITLFLSLIMVQKTLRWLNTRHHMHMKNIQDRSVWDYFRYSINQCIDEMHESTLAGNLLVLFLGFVAILVMELYQGCLLTQLLHPPKVQPFSDSDQMIDLIAENKIHMIASDTSRWWYYQELQVSNRSYFVRLRLALQNNPIRIETNLSTLLTMVENGPYIFATSTMEAAGLLQHHCSLMAVPGGVELPKIWAGFIFRQGFPMIGKFHETLIMTQEHSRSVVDKYLGDSVCIEKAASWHKISVVSFSGVFFMLVVGYTLGAVVLALEKYRWLHQRGTVSAALHNFKSSFMALTRSPRRQRSQIVKNGHAVANGHVLTVENGRKF